MPLNETTITEINSIQVPLGELIRYSNVLDQLTQLISRNGSRRDFADGGELEISLSGHVTQQITDETRFSRFVDLPRLIEVEVSLTERDGTTTNSNRIRFSPGSRFYGLVEYSSVILDSSPQDYSSHPYHLITRGDDIQNTGDGEDATIETSFSKMTDALERVVSYMKEPEEE